MYGRDYGHKILNFEASGGLLHNSLVMMDKETKSYWSIMDGVSLAGEFRGEPLRDLSVGVKTQWKHWVADHPDTEVLSLRGKEHVARNKFRKYFQSETSFFGVVAEDDRLPTKEPIYAFELDGAPYSVPFTSFEGGASFEVGERDIFLYRPAGVEIFHSTAAFIAPAGSSFEEREGAWTYSGALFDRDASRFEATSPNAPVLDVLDGFDTFWFNWSMNHPETAILGEP